MFFKFEIPLQPVKTSALLNSCNVSFVTNKIREIWKMQIFSNLKFFMSQSDLESNYTRLVCFHKRLEEYLSLDGSSL